MGIENGSKVSVHYKLTVEGRKVDTSEGREPLTFTFGSGQMIPGFEAEIAGMNAGEKKSFTVSPEKGYGQRRNEAVQKVAKTAFKDTEGLGVGSVVAIQAPDGNHFQATVTDVGDDEVTLDLNHPLAGKTLDFDVEIVDVGEAPSPIIKPGQ